MLSPYIILEPLKKFVIFFFNPKLILQQNIMNLQKTTPLLDLENHIDPTNFQNFLIFLFIFLFFHLLLLLQFLRWLLHA